MSDTKDKQEQNPEEILEATVETAEDLEESPENNPEIETDIETETSEKVTPEGQIEALQQELAETKDRMLRNAAESENFKKRMERDKNSLVKYAGENILRDLLDTLDNLDRAIEQGQGDVEDSDKKLASLLEGLELTRRGLLSCLDRYEVSTLNTVGEEFNPNEHEALTMEPGDEIAANHVIREFVKGYRFKDRLLRAAKVTVSSGPASE